MQFRGEVILLSPTPARAVHYKVFDKDLEFDAPSVRPKSISYPTAKVGTVFRLALASRTSKPKVASRVQSADVQRRQIRMVRGCEKFLPAVA